MVIILNQECFDTGIQTRCSTKWGADGCSVLSVCVFTKLAQSVIKRYILQLNSYNMNMFIE